MDGHASSSWPPAFIGKHPGQYLIFATVASFCAAAVITGSLVAAAVVAILVIPACGLVIAIARSNEPTTPVDYVARRRIVFCGYALGVVALGVIAALSLINDRSALLVGAAVASLAMIAIAGLALVRVDSAQLSVSLPIGSPAESFEEAALIVGGRGATFDVFDDNCWVARFPPSSWRSPGGEEIVMRLDAQTANRATALLKSVAVGGVRSFGVNRRNVTRIAEVLEALGANENN